MQSKPISQICKYRKLVCILQYIFLSNYRCQRAEIVWGVQEQIAKHNTLRVPAHLDQPFFKVFCYMYLSLIFLTM